MNEIVEYEEKPLTISELKGQVNLIQQVMKEVMRNGEHYGIIPGCGDKPALLKSGAEKLIFTFRLVPDPIEEIIELPNEHREYRYKIKLYTKHGVYLGAGVGSCSTMESKYRYRKAELTCPECGQTAIIKGKEEFGGGWLCYLKKSGCGKKWTDADNPFEGVSTDRVEHDNPADYYNTCQKMAKKRALVDACLTVTAASDIFTQDIEEMAADGLIGGQEHGKAKPPAAQPQRKSTTENNPFASDSVEGLTVKEVRVKTGTKGNKPWTKYEVITSDGVIYSTFSSTLGERAQEAEQSGAVVEVTGTESQYGHDLTGLTIVGIPAQPEGSGWSMEKIVSIISSSDSMDILDANWKSLLPHIGKLNTADKAECQKAYNVVEECSRRGE